MTALATPAPQLSAAHRVRIAAALRRAGLDMWTVADHQPEMQPLMTVAEAGRPGYVWLRPQFTPRFDQVQLEAETAIRIITMYAFERDRAVADPDVHATEAEALTLWERLRHAWEEST